MRVTWDDANFATLYRTRLVLSLPRNGTSEYLDEALYLEYSSPISRLGRVWKVGNRTGDILTVVEPAIH
jgi:hypothetical protein